MKRAVKFTTEEELKYKWQNGRPLESDREKVTRHKRVNVIGPGAGNNKWKSTNRTSTKWQ